MHYSSYIRTFCYLNIYFVKGLGEDCFRTWESVLLGAIPIVRNSTLWPIFKQAPVLVMDYDDNIKDISKDTLLQHNVENRSRKIILAQFWFEVIEYLRKRHSTINRVT